MIGNHIKDSLNCHFKSNTNLRQKEYSNILYSVPLEGKNIIEIKSPSEAEIFISTLGKRT